MCGNNETQQDFHQPDADRPLLRPGLQQADWIPACAGMTIWLALKSRIDTLDPRLRGDDGSGAEV
jgi:hypothetical protein